MDSRKIISASAAATSPLTSPTSPSSLSSNSASPLLPPSSSSSICLDLPSKEQSNGDASSSIINSLFPPASPILRRDPLHAALGNLGNYNSEPPVPNMKHASADGKSRSMPNMDMNSVYLFEAEVPCSGSSVHYGSRDMHIFPSDHTQKTSAPRRKHSHYHTEDEEDDSSNNLDRTDRGNWWEGSFYY